MNSCRSSALLACFFARPSTHEQEAVWPPLVAEVPPAARPAEAPRAAVGQPHNQVHAPQAPYKDPVAWRPRKQRLQCRFIPYGGCSRLHKLVGVKEQKFILSPFWWPELQNKAPAGPRSPQRLSGRIRPGVFQPLVLLAVCGVPCLVAASLWSLPPPSP